MSGRVGLFVSLAAILPALSPPETTPPGRSDQPTAEDLLRALQRERPLNEIIPPASAKGGPWPKSKRKLLPEGSALVDRRGVVVPDGDGWRFRFQDSADEPVYRLLPNALLEVLINAVDDAGRRSAFLISGEITTYGDENFLLLRGATRSEPTETPQPAAMPTSRTGSAADAPPSPAAATAPRTDADPEDVLRVLGGRAPARTALMGHSRASDDPTTRHAQRTRTLLPDGSPLIDRPGRALREGTGWIFTPETGGAERLEPTLRLLPCKGTEWMAKQAAVDPADLVFIVSGEITQFQNENYLLPRAVLRRTSTDNLRK